MANLMVSDYIEIPLESYYSLKIYTSGKVMAISNSIVKKGSALTTYYDKDGYVKLRIDGRTRTLHSLVAEAVYGPRPEGMHINHKDGNKRNNHPSNLEYCTPLENIHHALALGLRGRYTDEEKLDRARASARNFYHRNKDKAKEQQKRFKQNNPLYNRDYKRKRRQEAKNA